MATRQSTPTPLVLLTSTAALLIAVALLPDRGEAFAGITIRRERQQRRAHLAPPATVVAASARRWWSSSGGSRRRPRRHIARASAADRDDADESAGGDEETTTTTERRWRQQQQKKEKKKGDSLRDATGIRPSLNPTTINCVAEALLLRSRCILGEFCCRCSFILSSVLSEGQFRTERERKGGEIERLSRGFGLCEANGSVQGSMLPCSYTCSCPPC